MIEVCPQLRFFAIFILFVFGAPNLKAGTLVVSKRLGSQSVFTSGWSQAYKLTKTGDYIAPNAIKIDNRSFNFTCPGHSFLTGMSTKYEGGARRFKFQCTFFENAQGKLVSKTVASCNSKGWDNELLKNGTSTCTANQFIAGLNGLYASGATGATAPDAQFKAICCSVDTPDKTPVTPTACGGTQTLNTVKGNSGMTTCGANMVMQQISTTFQPSGTESDHIFTFKCCQLQN